MNIKGPYTSTSKEQKDYDDSGKNKLNLRRAGGRSPGLLDLTSTQESRVHPIPSQKNKFSKLQ